MFAALPWWALATYLLASGVVQCFVQRPLDASVVDRAEQRCGRQDHESEDGDRHFTPLDWVITTMDVVSTTKSAIVVTLTTATNTTRRHRDKVTITFLTYRAVAPTWNATVTQETYTRLTWLSNTTIVTVTDEVWAQDVEDTQVTETVYTSAMGGRHTRPAMTWGCQRNKFWGSGTVPCEATVWRMTVGDRGPVYSTPAGSTPVKCPVAAPPATQ